MLARLQEDKLRWQYRAARGHSGSQYTTPTNLTSPLAIDPANPRKHQPKPLKRPPVFLNGRGSKGGKGAKGSGSPGGSGMKGRRDNNYNKKNIMSPSDLKQTRLLNNRPRVGTGLKSDPSTASPRDRDRDRDRIRNINRAARERERTDPILSPHQNYNMFTTDLRGMNGLTGHKAPHVAPVANNSGQGSNNPGAGPALAPQRRGKKLKMSGKAPKGGNSRIRGF